MAADMTPLQPGPLSPGMVELLTAGRSVLRRGSFIGLYAPREGRPDQVRAEPLPEGPLANYGPADRYHYIGERSDDGWITAPPGGWGEPPVSGATRVTVRGRRWPNDTGRADNYDWRHAGADLDIIAFRLVDEAAQEWGSFSQEAKIPTAEPQPAVLAGPILEAIAHNLCSLHDFDPAFVAGQERFARAVITEYERATRAPDFALGADGMIAAARAKEAGE